MSDNPLLEFCNTEKQRQLVLDVEKYGSPTAAALAKDMNDSGYRKTYRKIKARAAEVGIAPECGMSQRVPEGFAVKGTSTLTKNDHGEMQWLKTDRKHEDMIAAMQAAADGFKDDLPRAFAIPESGTGHNKHIINQYTITDYHMGMLCWPEETGGDDWDLDIAESTIIKWFQHAITSAPHSDKCIFAQLGDFLHWDGLDAVTPASGHILDADTRFQKLVRVAIRTVRKIISMLLNRHNEVHVIMADANHDPASGIWLREWLSAHYDNEPRVIVDSSADTYYCHEFGNVSLFYHHGHKRRVANIDDVFVAKFRDVFGRTKYSYAHTGHLHSKEVVSTNLMKIEQHETLAAADAYAAKGGWISDRSAQVITYHKDHGEVGRVRITPEMIL